MGSRMMSDLNEIIGENIAVILSAKGKTVGELAEVLNLSVTEVRQMLWGGQIINVPMLNVIADFLEIESVKLVRLPANIRNRNIMDLFGLRVSSGTGRYAIRLADEISEMILFHNRVRENGERMMQPSD